MTERTPDLVVVADLGAHAVPPAAVVELLAALDGLHRAYGGGGFELAVKPLSAGG